MGFYDVVVVVCRPKKVDSTTERQSQQFDFGPLSQSMMDRVALKL